MRLCVLLIIIGSTWTTNLFGRQVDFFIPTTSQIIDIQLQLISQQDATLILEGNPAADTPHFRRLKAALLALFLGHFGVHRIYLGTTASVPIVYSLTLGGGLGLLPLVDFFVILTTKDLDQYINCDKVIMWVK